MLSDEIDKRTKNFWDASDEKFDATLLIASALVPPSAQLLSDIEITTAAKCIKALVFIFFIKMIIFIIKIGLQSHDSAEIVSTSAAQEPVPGQSLMSAFKERMLADLHRSRNVSGDEHLLQISECLKFIRSNNPENSNPIAFWSEINNKVLNFNFNKKLSICFRNGNKSKIWH